MKHLALAAFILIQLLNTDLPAQNRATLPDCAPSTEQEKCTMFMISANINTLVVGDPVDAVRQLAGDHFFLHFAFIIDKEGKVIHDFTEVECIVPSIKEKVVSYLNSLPEFTVPKQLKKSKDGRSVYLASITYVYDDAYKLYQIAPKEKLKALGIKFVPGTLVSQPRHKECADGDTEICTKTKITQYFGQNFQIPNVPAGSYKFMVTFTVDEDGDVDDVDASDPRFQNESKRLLKKLPRLIPATIREIPVRVQYNLPVTVNVTP